MKDKLLELLRKVHAGSSFAFPDNMDLHLLEATRSGTVDYDGFYRAMDRAISTIVLSQTMTTEDGSSRSQAEVHLDVRDELVQADAELVDKSFRRQVATWLRDWNWPKAAVPVVRRIMDNVDKQRTRAERDKLIVDMGHPLDRAYVEETYGVALAPEGEPAPAPELSFADDGSLPDALTGNARQRLGPLLDEWWSSGALGASLDAADDLPAFRRALAATVIDIGAFARSLRAALAGALLAGMLARRMDYDEGELDLAEDEGEETTPTGAVILKQVLDGARLPFDDQISFFRAKVSVPTTAWTDIWQEQHDVAFMVAGAARDDLLADLRAAVDSAIADGTTLAQFRKEFDSIVARHGWAYNGGRDWRTRVIYETNLATSFAAGEWRQMKEVAELRPYWMYRHSDAVEHPRHKHLEWDGLVLRHDDPWWQTNFPPNGWGCQCYVSTLSPRDLAAMGKSGPDTAPPLDWEEHTVGPSKRVVSAPSGVDPGFAYAPGSLDQAERLRLLRQLRR